MPPCICQSFEPRIAKQLEFSHKLRTCSAPSATIIKSDPFHSSSISQLLPATPENLPELRKLFLHLRQETLQGLLALGRRGLSGALPRRPSVPPPRRAGRGRAGRWGRATECRSGGRRFLYQPERTVDLEAVVELRRVYKISLKRVNHGLSEFL